MDEKMKELMQDKAFVEKLFELETPEEVQDCLAENGVEVTVDDIKQAVDMVSNHPDGTLNEEELENVSGGCVVCVLIFITSVGMGIATTAIQTRKRW